MECPKEWHPGCSCDSQGLEPNQDCWVHGYPDIRRCPYCGQMRGYFTACKRCGCDHGLSRKLPVIIFTAVPAEPCGNLHIVGDARFLSCSCSLAEAGAYVIQWHGPGLGLVCDNKADGERKAFMMNEAWNLASGFTPDELVHARLENMI